MPDCTPEDSSSAPCSLEEGARIRFTLGSEGDDGQREPAAELPPPVRADAPPTFTLQPALTPRNAMDPAHAPAPAHVAPVVPVAHPVPTVPPVPVAPAAAPVLAAPVAPDAVAAPGAAPEATPAGVPAPVATEAHTVQPEAPAGPPSDDLTKVMGAAGGGGMGLVALVILVVGGAAGWKFWNKFSEQKHEQRMKQMDLDAQEKGLGSAQPIPCQSVTKMQADAIAQLRAQVEELQGKVGKVEKKTATLSGSFDPEELEEWQRKVEKDLKALKTTKRAPAGGA